MGRDVGTVGRAPSVSGGNDRLLTVCGLTGRKLRGVSFSVNRGEIVGVAGMLGSGRSELARLLFGAQQPVAGSIELRGRQVSYRGPRDAVRQGVALVPEDRRGQGGMLEMSVADNLTLPLNRLLLPYRPHRENGCALEGGGTDRGLSHHATRTLPEVPGALRWQPAESGRGQVARHVPGAGHLR